MAHIEFLASELLTQIFNSLDSVQDVLTLSATCHRLRDIYRSSQQLRILWRVAERQYGPLSDATQLLTHNYSQSPLASRQVNVSLALLKQVVQAGNVAEAWADIYPFKKWKADYENRRLLTEGERRRVRRAVYRLWLYTLAFHTPAHPREQRLLLHAVGARREFLRMFATEELGDMVDVHGVLRDVLAYNVCPSNGAVARKVRQRYGEEAGRQLVFNVAFRNSTAWNNRNCCAANLPIRADDENGIFANQWVPSVSHGNNGGKPAYKRDCNCHYTPTPTVFSRFSPIDGGSEGWGDDLSHEYVVNDMLKLSPAQILYLKLTKPRKADVFAWLATNDMGPEWFDNYGDTWGESVEGVLRERLGGEEQDVLLADGVLAQREED
jgi:hypothetical protein